MFDQTPLLCEIVAGGPDGFHELMPSAFSVEESGLNAHLLCIGGDDHHLRIPFLLALADRGFRVTAAGTGDPEPFRRARLEYRAINFDRFINPVADWGAIKSLSKLLTDVRADLVQSFDTKPNLLVPLAARGLRESRVIRTINGLGWIFSSRSPIAKALAPIYCALHRQAARSTALTVFQNQDDKRFFEGHGMLGQGGSRLIAGSGIDVDLFERAAAAAPESSVLRESLGVDVCETVVTVTRLTRQKGIRTLLAAAALVHKVRPGVRFLLVGPRQSEGPMAVSQAEIDRHAPYVIAPGRRSDIPAVLTIADIFAFPTEYREGVPRCLLEAALAGLPIVTTRMPGCCDVVRDGWSGFLVPPRAPRILAARIVDLLRDRNAARLMGTRARALVKRDFNLPVTVTRYTQVYEELLGGAAEDRCGADGEGRAPFRDGDGRLGRRDERAGHGTA